MIINQDRKPTLSLYYLGGKILEKLNIENNLHIEPLFNWMKVELKEELHVDFFYYTLDWLYVLSLIKIENGRVVLC